MQDLLVFLPSTQLAVFISSRFLSFLPVVVLIPVSITKAVIPFDMPSDYLLKLGKIRSTDFPLSQKKKKIWTLSKKVSITLPWFTLDKPHVVFYPNLHLLLCFQLLFPSSGFQKCCVLLCSDLFADSCLDLFSPLLPTYKKTLHLLTFSQMVPLPPSNLSTLFSFE